MRTKCQHRWKRFENEIFLKSSLLTNLRYNWWFNDFRHNERQI